MGRVDDELPAALRSIIRDELAGLGICTFARVTDVTHETQRVGVELVSDPGWETDNVPLVSPGAPGGDGVGDIPGIQAGDEVLVVFTADDTGAMTTRRGTVPDTPRHRDHRDVVAIPLGPYMDSDQIPDHEPGDRIIAHPNGTMLRLGSTGEPDFEVDHPSGVGITVDSPVGDDDDRPDSPAEVRLDHPSGMAVRTTREGIEILPGDTDGDDAGGWGEQTFGEGEWGAGGREQGVQTYRSHDNPWRVEAYGDADRQMEGHRHLVPQSDGTNAMTGPPLAMRELFAWFCVDANFSSLVNSDAPAMQDAQSFYTAYRDWIGQQSGYTLGADLPRLGGDSERVTDWPYPEPVPDASERDGFDPTVSRGDGDGE